MFVSRTHRATRKNWSDLRSNEGGSEKNSARNSISPVIPTANRFHFLPASLATSAPTPPRIDLPRPRERWNEDKTRRKCKMFRFDYITAPVLYGTRWTIFFLPINLINTFIDDSFFLLFFFFNCIKLLSFDSLEEIFKYDIENWLSYLLIDQRLDVPLNRYSKTIIRYIVGKNLPSNNIALTKKIPVKGIVMRCYVSFVTGKTRVAKRKLDRQARFRDRFTRIEKSLSRRVSEPVSSCQG